MMEYFKELLNILNAMSPYLLLGFLVAGLLHVYVPKSTFSKYLSKRGFKSVFLSALFGVPLPLCSCGVIPTAMSLKKEGASDGATVSFLIATPQTGIDSILATYGVLGLPFAIIRPIVAFIVAIFGGALVDKFTISRVKDSEHDKSSRCYISKPKKLNVIDALRYGFVEMLQDLGKWLTIGLLIAATITVFVPSSIFEVMHDYYLLNILIVLLFSIPMYICSTGSIPIAVSLLMMGISPGAALVFLMAGPATNVATLAVLRNVLGIRTTILYLLSITLGAIGFAVLIDFALPAEWFTLNLSAVSSCGECSDGAAWWQTASSILFIVLLINAYILRLRNGHTHSTDMETVAIQKFKVEGMRCNHCKANVEKAVSALPNVVSVAIDLSNGLVEVEGSVSLEEVKQVVEPLGFKVFSVC
ncbi:MAG: SO_0444 family Cu/Zn efflux transporter [Rikenellaceae bacterium]